MDGSAKLLREPPFLPSAYLAGFPWVGPSRCGDDEGLGNMKTVDLAGRYVRLRAESGFVNPRSAEQIRYRLWDFCDNAPENPMRVRRGHVEAWMARPDLAPNYLRSRLSALRGFCRWCVARRYMKLDPTLDVPMPHVPAALPKRMTGIEARSLTEIAAGDVRTALIVSLMLQEALRRIEVARLDIEDIDFAERTMQVRGKGGRGAATGLLPLSDETWALMVRYRAEEGNPTHGPLIRNRVRKNPRMAASTISALVHDAMVDAGVKRLGDASRTPHSCRHTAAHDLLASTRDVRAVQQALRHSSVRSTELYLRGEIGDLRAVMGGRQYRSAP